jgi:hypothetical protein
MPYILEAYAPVEVLRLRDDHDGRTWVVRIGVGEANNEFWVGSAQVYDTEEACIIGNTKTLESGIKQMEFEAKQSMKRAAAARKALHRVSPEGRIEQLEKLLKCINHNLETIEYSCHEDGCMAGRNLAKEAREWIKRADIGKD